jgi:hypothetical protein
MIHCCLLVNMYTCFFLFLLTTLHEKNKIGMFDVVYMSHYEHVFSFYYDTNSSNFRQSQKYM